MPDTRSSNVRSTSLRWPLTRSRTRTPQVRTMYGSWTCLAQTGGTSAARRAKARPDRRRPAPSSWATTTPPAGAGQPACQRTHAHSARKDRPYDGPGRRCERHGSRPGRRPRYSRTATSAPVLAVHTRQRRARRAQAPPGWASQSSTQWSGHTVAVSRSTPPTASRRSPSPCPWLHNTRHARSFRTLSMTFKGMGCVAPTGQ
jgi:hypothetical protein